MLPRTVERALAFQKFEQRRLKPADVVLRDSGALVRICRLRFFAAQPAQDVQSTASGTGRRLFFRFRQHSIWQVLIGWHECRLGNVFLYSRC